jgi:hypothetical protein
MPFTSLPLSNVTIDGSFWGRYQQLVHESTLSAIYEQLNTRGPLDALRLNWKPGMPNTPHIYWESDVAKWLEAASYTLARFPDPALDAQVDEVIALLASAQHPDGYLSSYYTVVEPGRRFTNLRDQHELYCAGHLIEAAVAHHEATGKNNLLDIMLRYADLIDTTFGPDDDQKHGYPGHEEIELALIRLYRTTGDERYFKLSRYFIEQRGQQPHYFDEEAHARGDNPADFRHGTYEYNQSHLPIREHTHAVGHAVRGTYLYTAVTELAIATGDESLVKVLKRVADSLIQRRMYVTGGIGSVRQNEGFTRDYDLPNDTSYAETCAAIGLFFWMYRMVNLTGDSYYANVMERALYNGILSGLSLDGKRFFYENLLAVTRGTEKTRFMPYHRHEWFSVACCPPNISRLIASLNRYLYSQGQTEIVVHLYAPGTARFDLGGQTVVVHQQTDYPWNGEIHLRIELTTPAEFSARLRIPDWCRTYALSVNSTPFDAATSQGYLSISRQWQNGDTITLYLDMPVERVYAHPLVSANRGRVALQRGPMVYCLEGVDNGESVDLIVLPRDAELSAHFEPDLLGGVVVIEADALRAVVPEMVDGVPYFQTEPQYTPLHIRAVPYYAWDNRDSGDLLVWIREN